MILDRNDKIINIGDKVKNLDNKKEFVFTKEMEIVLHHAELFPYKLKETFKYTHLIKL